MKKKYIYFLLILAAFGSLIWFIQASTAKYKDKSDLDISITSAKMYFEDNATDVTIPYSHNTANIYFDVQNYLDQNYTIEDINYTISISNSNYTFYINNTPATNNSLDMVLTGGEANSENLHMVFERLDTSDVPASEEVQVTISTDYPYKYTKTFTVTILDGAIEVQGNPTNWTRDDVTLTIVPTTAGITLREYSFDGGTTWQPSDSKVYTENTDNITVYAKDNLGQTLGPVVVDITKIDKTPPTLTFSKDIEYEANGTEKQVETLIVTLHESTNVLTKTLATDSQSGISEERIKCYRNGVEITKTDYFTEVGRYEVTYKVKDKVGNETEKTREILVRWPTGGKYVVERQDVIGTGLAYTSTGAGLYRDTSDTGLDPSLPFSSKYYYSGKDVNNYVSFAGKTFRILNIPVNDDIKIIAPVSGNTWQWGDRKIYESNVYSNWSTKWWPRGQLYNSDDSEYILFTAEQNAHVDEATFYAGRFDRGSSTSIATTIQEERTGAYYLGGDSAAFQGKSAFPNVSDYLKSCNAMDIVYSIRTSQTNQSTYETNSWLSDSNEQWTMNAKNATITDNDFWVLYEGNEIVSRTYYYPQKYRPVLYLKEDTILSGTGTLSDPFTVQENWGWFDSYQTLQAQTQTQQHGNVVELQEGDHVMYVDANGVERECIVLYDYESGYGIQIITADTVEEIEIGNGTGTSGQVSNDSTDGATKFNMALTAYNESRPNLNAAARAYVNTNLSPENGARSVGTPPDNPDIENPMISSSREYINGVARELDEYYTTDTNQMAKSNINIRNIRKKYWLGSYYHGSITSRSTLLGVRYVNRNDSIGYNAFLSISATSSESYSQSETCGLRPVFTLKDTIYYKEGATSSSPYILSVTP